MRRDCPLCYNNNALRGTCTLCKGIGTIGVRSDYASPEIVKDERATEAKKAMEGFEAVKRVTEGPHWRELKQRQDWRTATPTEYKGLYGSDE